VRRFIEEKGPLVGLHGHIHESQGADKLHPTSDSKKRSIPIFNPGSEYHMGVLRGILLNIKDNAKIDYIFTRG